MPFVNLSNKLRYFKTIIIKIYVIIDRNKCVYICVIVDINSSNVLNFFIIKERERYVYWIN